MKKTCITILFGLFAACIFTFTAGAKEPQIGYQKQLPDLVVNLTLVKEAYTSQGKTCYSIKPKYSVSNEGKAAAGAFHIKVEWNAPNAWQVFTEFKVDSLLPGKTFSHVPSNSDTILWCPGVPARGWRITADSKTEVIESNEHNNTATRVFSLRSQ